jgi:plastocyanin
MSKLTVIGVCGFLLMVAFIMNGCEVDSATETVTISPSSVTVRKGQTVQFTASGGYEYQWALSDTYGTLSATRGQTVTYTCLYNAVETNKTVEGTLTVTSVIPGDSAGTNSTSSTQASGEAIITHVSS